MPIYDGVSYKTGTYLLTNKKQWNCASPLCISCIPSGSLVFTRIKCFGPHKKNQRGEFYQEKVYTRFHVECAMKLTDLNDEEKDLLGNEFFKYPEKYKNEKPILLDK